MKKNGFSILEMLFATIILLIGLVAIAQLVPATILMNHHNQTDSSALVFAQRELDEFLGQPISTASFNDSMFNFCLLGDPALPNTVQGGPLLSPQALIDFSAAPIDGFSFTYPPASAVALDPTLTVYDVRWAVIIAGDGSTVSSKRFIIGIRQIGGNGYFTPVTLDTVVAK